MSSHIFKVSCALAALLVSASPASADENFGSSFYLSATGGINQILDIDYADTSNTAPYDGTTAGEVTFDYGMKGSLALGTYLGDSLRAELELGYRDNGLDAVKPTGGSNTGMSGSATTTTVMGKLDYDFTLWGFKPYIGAGLGVASFAYDDKLVFDSDKVVFAGLLETGTTFALSDSVDLFTNSQLLILSDVSLAGGGLELDRPVELSSSIGLRFHF